MLDLLQRMLKNRLEGRDLGVALFQVKEMDHPHAVVHMIDDDAHRIPVIQEDEAFFTGVMQIGEDICDLVTDGIFVFILEK